MSGKKRKGEELEESLRKRLAILKGERIESVITLEQKLNARLAKLKEGQENLFDGFCKQDDWDCWTDKYRKSQIEPIITYETEKKRTSQFAPTNISPDTRSKLDTLKLCFGTFSIPLNEALKELDVWYSQHPVLTIAELKQSGSVPYKKRFIDWICRGLTIPATTIETKFENKKCPYLPPSLTLRERKNQQIGPIRFFLRWFRALTDWSRKDQVHEALIEWTSSSKTAPALDFYSTWIGNLFFTTVCEKKMLALLVLIDLATVYLKEVSSPCGEEIQKFLQGVNGPCEKIREMRK